MKIITSTLIIFLFTISISAQIHWLQVVPDINGINTLYDLMSTENIAESGKVQLINYNPSITLEGISELDLPSDGISQCNIFTIYKPSLNVKEELIWQLSQEHEDQLLLTDERMADLSQGKFMNFVEYDPFKAQINSYHHYRNAFEADKMIIGGQPKNQAIPVSKYDGQLAELIVFNHKLAPIAQQVLEGHLALKYSIPLHPRLDYLGGLGKPIWKYKENEEYSNNIAGLGRNDELHLHQKQSKSEFGDGYIAFGNKEIKTNNTINPHSLQNLEYLIWGDDNGIIDFEEIHQDVHLLQRTWKMNSDRITSTLKLAFQMNHHGLDKSLESNQHYWLLTSKKPIQQIEIQSSQIYPLNKEADSYNSINIDTEELDHFTILKAPRLWMQIELKNPICGSEEQGSINVKPIGGNAPYLITLFDHQENKIDQVKQWENNAYSFQNLNADKYIINIEDAKSEQWKTELFLNSSGMPEIDLPVKMILDEQTIFLDSEIEIDQTIDYSWTLPNGEMTNASSIEINSTGDYTLLIEIENCKLWHQVIVTQENNNIANTKVYPNPTTNGYFTFSAELKQATPYSISISDVSGHIVSEQTHKMAKYISFNYRIKKGGTYFITLTSNNTTKTEKLIVISEQ